MTALDHQQLSQFILTAKNFNEKISVGLSNQIFLSDIFLIRKGELFLFSEFLNCIDYEMMSFHERCIEWKFIYIIDALDFFKIEKVERNGFNFIKIF